MLGIQLLGIVSILTWTIVMSYIFLKVIDLTLGLRVSLEDEILGADVVMHGLARTSPDSRHRHNGSIITMATSDDEEEAREMTSPAATRHKKNRRSSTYVHHRSGTNLAFWPEEDHQPATEYRRRTRAKLSLRSCSSNSDVTRRLAEGTVSSLATYL